MKKGFTFIEIIITLALLAIVSTIILFSFNALNNKQALDKNIDFIKSLINQARVNALNSKNGKDQTIIFSTSSVVYDNNIFELNDNVTLQSYNMATNTVIFNRITGNPSATGTFIYMIKNGDDIYATTSIIINNLGIIE